MKLPDTVTPQTSPSGCPLILPALALLLAAAVVAAGCTMPAVPGGGTAGTPLKTAVQNSWALNAEAKFAEADLAAGQALALDAADPDALAMRGWARAGLGKYDEALVALDASLAQNPDNALTWSNKGFSLFRLGRCPEAIKAFDRALERDPYEYGAAKFRGLAQTQCPAPPAAAVTPTAAGATAVPKVTDNMNPDGVSSGAVCGPRFTFATPVKVTHILTYHYHNGQGAAPGTISLEDTGTGKVWGPYTATGSDGQGGVRNAFWTVTPGVVIPAGTYLVKDSDPATWSQNEKSQKCGMSQINYVEVSA